MKIKKSNKNILIFSNNYLFNDNLFGIYIIYYNIFNIEYNFSYIYLFIYFLLIYFIKSLYFIINKILF